MAAAAMPPMRTTRQVLLLRLGLLLLLLGSAATVVEAFVRLTAPGRGRGLRPLPHSTSGLGRVCGPVSGVVPLAGPRRSSSSSSSSLSSPQAVDPAAATPNRRAPIRRLLSRLRGGEKGGSPSSLAAVNWKAFWCVYWFLT